MALEINNDGLLTNDEVDARSPEFRDALERMYEIIDQFRREGIGEEVIGNVLLNMHVGCLVELNPTDDQIDSIADIFRSGARQLRDHYQEANK